MKIFFSLAAFFFAASAQAAINGRCSVNGTPGVCLTTASCSSGGGKSTAGFCPNDPTNVQCCTKTCGSGGSCKWTDQCSGTKTTGQYLIFSFLSNIVSSLYGMNRSLPWTCQFPVLHSRRRRLYSYDPNQ